jgi:tetratricopeptide (TPR) repeat protein
MRDAVSTEIIAAFNEGGVVGVSTAPAPPAGKAPSYALGGTIQRDGDSIRVFTHLTNERSGATLWTGKLNYEKNQLSRIPRRIAVDVGNVVRCGLFGASTYKKPLPDAVFRDYMQYCQSYWDTNMAEGRKALIPIQRVNAAVPDFSWGWAALTGTYWKLAMTADSSQSYDEARANGREAADRAIALDGRNSEALFTKAMLLDPHDWSGREDLFKRALASRRLDCGCERHQYGDMLVNVGRTSAAVEQLRQATDMLALYVYTPLSLAQALVISGKPGEAKTYYDAAIQLAPDPGLKGNLAFVEAASLKDIQALSDPGLPVPDAWRAALVQGYRAVKSRNAAAKAKAVKDLLALPDSQIGSGNAWLLAELGATHDAFRIASLVAERQYPGPSVFWHPSMRGALRDPGFPAVAEKLGLMTYWKTSKTRPDVCGEKDPAPFCRMI